MHIQRGRLYIGLAEHYMHLPSMVGLVVEKMQDGYGCRFHVDFSVVICVRNGSSKEITIRFFEKRFYSRVLFDSR